MAKKNTAQAPLTPAVLHILLALSTGEGHGYGIMKQVYAFNFFGGVHLGGTGRRRKGLIHRDVIKLCRVPDVHGFVGPGHGHFASGIFLINEVASLVYPEHCCGAGSKSAVWSECV